MKVIGNNQMKLIFQLARNDIKSKYANSILGIVWAFIMPLVTILVFWYVFQMGFKNLPVGDAPYIFWFSVAYIPWIFFSDVLVSGCNCLVEYSYLVKKIKFDVRIIPLVKLISSLLVHAFFVLFIFLMLLCFHYPISIYNIQALYYTLAVCCFSLGITYLLSAVTVFFKDTVSIVNVVIQIGFWITPIMWNEETLADAGVRRVLGFNPLHYIVAGYRDSFLNHRWFWESPGDGLYFWILTIVLFLIGWRVFHKMSPFFADEV